MTPFLRLEAIAASLPFTNVDTDKILPGRFLKTIHRKGLGGALFADLRDDPDFVLNRPPWSEAGILVAFENFGCGSSREHAPWALLDFGIRCVIAPSIADIFYNNCCKNGILPIALPQDAVVALMHDAEDLSRARLIVDLPGQTIINCDGRSFHFDIDARRKRDLMEGTDDISRSLMQESEIAAYEADRKAGQPWFPAISQCRLTASKSGIHECEYGESAHGE